MFWGLSHSLLLLGKRLILYWTGGLLTISKSVGRNREHKHFSICNFPHLLYTCVCVCVCYLVPRWGYQCYCAKTRALVMTIIFCVGLLPFPLFILNLFICITPLGLNVERNKKTHSDRKLKSWDNESVIIESDFLMICERVLTS